MQSMRSRSPVRRSFDLPAEQLDPEIPGSATFVERPANSCSSRGRVPDWEHFKEMVCTPYRATIRLSGGSYFEMYGQPYRLIRGRCAGRRRSPTRGGARGDYEADGINDMSRDPLKGPRNGSIQRASDVSNKEPAMKPRCALLRRYRMYGIAIEILHLIKNRYFCNDSHILSRHVQPFAIRSTVVRRH